VLNREFRFRQKWALNIPTQDTVLGEKVQEIALKVTVNSCLSMDSMTD
jgi:hypothetical protein